tara:strand:- start:1217 stop:1543 length:327 start_codon:yes stop_codon:yes gene_type:complete
MSNEKNLKPFEKGVSGNPSGRPKWKHVTEVMKQELDEDKLISMVHMVYELAMEGNMRAVEFIADRVEGKVAQRVTVTTSDETIPIFHMEDYQSESDDDEPVITKISNR